MNREKLLKEKENILKNIESRKDRVAKIDELIKELDNKKWKPKYNDKYYYINCYGHVQFYIMDGCDNNLFLIGNYFKTKEEAEFEVERLKVLEELKEFSYEFNDEEWKSNDVRKYYIYYGYQWSSMCIEYSYRYNRGSIYFKTKEDAQKAIDKIGEERLKKYYFKVGNK